MNYKLPSVSAVLLLCSAAFAQPLVAQSLVALASQQLLGQHALEAKIRQRIDLFGQQLVGSGEYRQLGEGPDKLLRLELKIQTDSQVVSLLQVSDDRFLWIRRDLPQDQSLSRVDLRQVRSALQQPGRAPAIDPARAWMALGGLAKLLQGLDENFSFDQPVAGHVQQFPVWIVEGRWKAKQLAQVMPQHQAAIEAGQPVPLEDLPAHLPDRVRLVLARDDVIPLFPFRIEYLRPASSEEAGAQQPTAPSGGDQVGVKSILVMEFYEVRTPLDLDPSQFIYQPGEQEMADVTDEYLQQLGLQQPKGARPAR